MNMFKGYDLDNLERQCIKEAAEFSRTAAAEGLVLLKNESVLPFDKSKTLSIFGRTQIDYVKSGTGSGGLVHPPYTVTILEGLSGRIKINEDLLNTYKTWLLDNPFDKGNGWATEPWAQIEMPVSDELCEKAAKTSDYALVVIGRTAGEDKDNMAEPMSYLLSEAEENLIKTVAKHFDKVCVALNTGNIIDMSWVEKYNIPCVLYSWQGGMEGGNAFADVLLGDVSPSGKLTDTIAYSVNDYPSDKNHGAKDKNCFEEDIYVGYRYFETFAKDKVMYPFGFGLSYTKFNCDYNAKLSEDAVKISVNVKNIGKYSGKSVVQVYFGAPQGNLGKPTKQLIRYKKTKTLAPQESETLTFEFKTDEMASYDDSKTFSYILESGKYIIYAGENVRDAKEILNFELEEKTVCKLRQALAPVENFNRIKPLEKDGKFEIISEAVTTRQYDLEERKKEHITKQEQPVGNKGIMLKDVKDGKYTMDEFIAQLSVEELSYLVKGEGCNSPKVEGGTTSAFGGITEELLSYGIPPTCTSDGPSGIRMDTGKKATLMPNGTCIASTWNTELAEELQSYIGIELRSNNIDILLSPGINIHRHPLNGRNFEYFSEDPYLAGTMAAAFTRGFDSAGVACSLKHFACNSQEYNRARTDVVISERALREIYLKPFEIAVKTGNATVIMTSYNRINGIHTASSYDLNTSILRDEWGFKGFVMTDWWTLLDPNEPDDVKNRKNLIPMLEAQNDIYKVTASSKENDDNIITAVKDGTLDIYYLRKCVKNLLNFIMNSPAMNRKPKDSNELQRDNYSEFLEIENVTSRTQYDVKDADAIELEYATTGSELAQHVITPYSDGCLAASISVKATGGKKHTVIIELPDPGKPISIHFPNAFTHMKLTALKKR